MNGWDSEPGDASGTGFLCTAVNCLPSDLTVIAFLELNYAHLLLGGTRGVPTNATRLVTHCEDNKGFIPLWNKILILKDSSVVW